MTVAYTRFKRAVNVASVQYSSPAQFLSHNIYNAGLACWVRLTTHEFVYRSMDIYVYIYIYIYTYTHTLLNL